jgi:hypothetical protein
MRISENYVDALRKWEKDLRESAAAALSKLLLLVDPSWL